MMGCTHDRIQDAVDSRELKPGIAENRNLDAARTIHLVPSRTSTTRATRFTDSCRIVDSSELFAGNCAYSALSSRAARWANSSMAARDVAFGVQGHFCPVEVAVIVDTPRPKEHQVAHRSGNANPLPAPAPHAPGNEREEGEEQKVQPGERHRIRPKSHEA